MKLCCLVHPMLLEDMDAFAKQDKLRPVGTSDYDNIPMKVVRCHDCRETICERHFRMIKTWPKRIRCLKCFRKQIQPHRKGMVKRVKPGIKVYKRSWVDSLPDVSSRRPAA